ncbi:MAG: glycosyltransferase family 4 protein [Saprospiraceae bacterium]
MLCIDWFAPGYKAGGPISSCVNFVKGLEDVFELYVFTTNTDLGETQPYPGIPANQWLPFSKATSVYYCSQDRLSVREIKRQIQHISPDYLYLNSLFSVHFTLLPLLLYKFGQIRSDIILAPRGMLRESALRYKARKKQLFLALARSFQLYKGVRFHATDEQELKDIQTLLPQVTDIHLIANLAKSAADDYLPIVKQAQEVRCVFIGRIHPIKNLLFFLQVLQRVTAFQVDFTIIGNLEDEAYWQDCQQVIQQLPAHVRVQYLGGVPGDAIAGYLQQHHFMLLPTQGENFGHAIFESFLVGRPVIISDQTPWRHLAEQQVGFDLPLQDAQCWLSALQTAAAMSQETYDEWAQAALQYARQYIASSGTKAKYVQLFS